MIRRAIKSVALIAAATIALHSPGAAAQNAYTFYVLNQRSVALTAQYWNPILTHVSQKSGVPLELKMAKTPQEGNVRAEKGDYDFQYTNHFFTPERDRLGWKVIARPAGPGIPSKIVVPGPVSGFASTNASSTSMRTFEKRSNSTTVPDS